ncbi:Cyclin-dependent kinase 6 [Lachnellula arida]|uniref:Cyclin-dependent kinase 6 n=1 Tax=Lachnellula arida TaxID=1316785 RepID=A0A8T9BL72_9HELO|nr:Cyclin-dependent kinase 6 [Lachnellula arida]
MVRTALKCLVQPFTNRFHLSQKKPQNTEIEDKAEHQQGTPASSSRDPASKPIDPPNKPTPKIAIRKATEPVPAPTPETLPLSPNSLVPEESSRRNSESSSQRSRSDSKGSTTDGDSLKKRLRGARKECLKPSQSFFVPRAAQDELLTRDAIAKDIQARNPDIGEDTALESAEKARECAKQLFATLAYIRKGADICPLLQEGITDQDLPLVRASDGSFSLQRRTGEPIKTFEEWNDEDLEQFDRVQYWMTAPVFQDKKHYNLDENAILPFMKFKSSETQQAKQGGYSEVFPVRIHPAHHEFWEPSGREDDEPLVAVKQLFSPNETEFQKELTILKALGSKSSPHPHLIKLLATYKREEKYHLMFPYANANLRTYWEERPKPSFDEATVSWSMRQMTGIANALNLIHNFSVTIPLNVPGAGEVRVKEDVKLSVRRGEELFGRHGDIKPENVLWFKESCESKDAMGVLQIADFGLGRFHGRDSRSKVPPDGVFSSPTYEPPECKLRHPVSRAYDIWSLGCLYLEFITWLLRGSAEIEGFSNFRGRDSPNSGVNEDRFFTMDEEGTGATVRDEVITWIDQLHCHERCSQLIHDLLDLTMKELLIIESKERSNAAWLFQQLKMYLRKAEKDKEYMLKAVPRQQKPPNERSQSTPTSLGPLKGHGKRISFSDSPPNRPASKTQSKVQINNDPKDLVLRKIGTPNYKPKKGGTWPPNLPVYG